MHYTVDPIRDGLLTRQHHEGKVLHVFGGDYGIPWGIGNRPKASRMSELMDNIAPDMVDHFVGPMLTRDGHKLAKSNGDSHETPPVSVLQDLLSKNRSFIEIVA